MQIELVPTPDDPVERLAVERAAVAQLAFGAGRPPENAWWRAGLLEELERAPSPTRDGVRYDAAPPRSTRGATRA